MVRDLAKMDVLCTSRDNVETEERMHGCFLAWPNRTRALYVLPRDMRPASTGVAITTSAERVGGHGKLGSRVEIILI